MKRKKSYREKHFGGVISTPPMVVEGLTHVCVIRGVYDSSRLFKGAFNSPQRSNRGGSQIRKSEILWDPINFQRS